MRPRENHKVWWAATLLASLAPSVSALPLSATAFTYQGQLKYNGIPVTDNCDIELALFDVQLDGVAIATETFFKVEVVDGLFTVRPDFGTNPFDGSPKYLEVTVSCSGAQNVTLSPRQEISPTPESLYSTSTRGMVVDGSGQIGIGTSTPGTKMTISRATQQPAYQLELRNEGSIQSPNFDGIAFTQEADGSTELASIKVGYRNNGRPDLSFSVRDEPDALFINGNHSSRGGNVGIGTTAPEAKLHVSGDIRATGNVRTDGEVIIPPTIRYLTIGAADMVPQDTGMTVWRSFASIVSFFAPAGQATTLYAPVHLPNGATVTELRAFLSDNAPDGDVFVSLEAESIGGGTLNLGVILTEGTPGTIEAVDNTIQDAVIDNASFAYYLRVVYTVPPVDGETYFRIRPVRIAYEITSPLP